MDNTEILAEINNWQIEISKPDFNDKMIELAFFKIFVKFEKFLTNIFIHYSIGKKSVSSFKPKRKLGFTSVNQLSEIIKGSNKSYIDYPKIIAVISLHIFKDQNDPFALIFNDPTFLDNYRKMQYIRNFIAHESEESKLKYLTNVLETYNIRTFKPAYEFLLMNNRRGISYYSIYIKVIQDYSGILVNPAPYLV